MSRFRAKFAGLTHVAEGEQESILDLLAAEGITFPDGEAILNNPGRGNKISCLDIIAGPLANNILTQPTKDAAVEEVFRIFDEYDAKFEGHPQYNKVGDNTRNKIVNNTRTKRNAEAVYFYIANMSQAGAGNSVASSITASAEEEFGPNYKNQRGHVTGWHILFNDYADEIAGMNKQEAVDFVMSKLDEFEQTFAGDDTYSHLGQGNDQSYQKFQLAIQDPKVRNGMGVLFKIKDFLLGSEGLYASATLDELLSNPKTAKKAAHVFNTLIATHNKIVGKSTLTKKADDGNVEAEMVKNYFNELPGNIDSLAGALEQYKEEIFESSFAAAYETIIGEQHGSFKTADFK
jgi:hypothetical protein